MSVFRSGAAVVAVVVAVAVGGCSTSLEPYLPEPQEVSVEELWMRPSVDDAAAELDRLLAEIRGRWESELGLGPWSASSEGGRTGCGLDVGTDFEERSVPSWIGSGPIPDADWPRVLEIAVEVGAGYGFGAPQVVVARPGQYDASLLSATGARVRFGSGKANTTVGGKTGCHPTAEALAERGDPPS